MSASLLLDAEAKLASDQDGSYRAKLIAKLEKYRDEFAFSRQGFLPPEEYEVAEGMEGALEAALTVIREFDADEIDLEPEEEAPAGQTFNTVINV